MYTCRAVRSNMKTMAIKAKPPGCGVKKKKSKERNARAGRPFIIGVRLTDGARAAEKTADSTTMKSTTQRECRPAVYALPVSKCNFYPKSARAQRDNALSPIGDEIFGEACSCFVPRFLSPLHFPRVYLIRRLCLCVEECRWVLR